MDPAEEKLPLEGVDIDDSRTSSDSKTPRSSHGAALGELKGSEFTNRRSDVSNIANEDGVTDPEALHVDNSAGRGIIEDEDADSESMRRIESAVSIAETLPLYQEILFVFVICLAQLFTQAGLGQVIPIIHIIGENYDLGESPDLTWFIAGYSLTVGTFILFSGRLGDVFGYKKIFLIGMAWWSVWSLVCGLAVYSTHVLFTFARVLQGIGPALCLPNALAILGVTYAPGKRKSIVFSLFAATAPSGAVLGSVFTSLFALSWWPWSFWCFSIILAVVVVLGYYAIPPCPPPANSWPPTFRARVARLDIPGAVIGITGLLLFNFAWNQAPIAGWDMPYVYATLILGILSVAAFFVVELYYTAEPLIPFHVLSSDVSFVLGAIVCGWSSFGIWYWYSWQFLSEIRGGSPLLVTAWFSPVAVAGLAAAGFVGLLLHRVGPPVVMTGALLAFSIGTILMATAPVDQTYWAQSFVAVLVTPFGMDMSFPAATLILSDAMPRKHQGVGASLINTLVNYSVALGLGFAGTVETRVNNGGRTPEDRLRGYRGAFYMGIGLAGLGVATCVAFLIKTHRSKRAKADEKAQRRP